MENKRIIVYDFETNGLWNRLTQPIEVHFRVIEPDGREWSWGDYVACKWKLPVEVTQLTGITDAMLREQGRPIEEVFARIRDMLWECDSLLVGHNILRFDNFFLNYYLQKFFTLRYQVARERCFDTCAEFKAVLLGMAYPGGGLLRGDWHHKVLYTRSGKVESSLEDACKYYGVDYAGAHTAGGDVAMTTGVFLAQCRAAGMMVPGTPREAKVVKTKARKKKVA